MRTFIPRFHPHIFVDAKLFWDALYRTYVIHMLSFVWEQFLLGSKKGGMWTLCSGRQVVATNKDMVAREGLEPRRGFE
jgi:hypothetical protein